MSVTDQRVRPELPPGPRLPRIGRDGAHRNLQQAASFGRARNERRKPSPQAASFATSLVRSSDEAVNVGFFSAKLPSPNDSFSDLFKRLERLLKILIRNVLAVCFFRSHVEEPDFHRSNPL